MATETTQRTIQIDAAGRPLGRVASEAASHILGKTSPDFAKNKVADVIVEVSNVEKLKISEAKRMQKIYQRYSGYPSGQKEMTLSELIEKKGYAEVLRRAVDGMIPRNRLRNPRMKNLIIK